MKNNERISLITGALKNFPDYNPKKTIFVRAPGRINLVGGHTDYNLGYVLPCTVDRDIIIGAFPSGDDIATFNSLNFNEIVFFEDFERTIKIFHLV